MAKMINVLIEEHRNLEKLLMVLEQELDVFDNSEQPDYEILQAVIDYFQYYPEGYHHPKEDILFEKLKLRDSAAAERIGDIEEEHETETVRLERFAEAVGDVLAGREYLRQNFHDMVREFIDYQRRHMQKEEEFLFPAAAKALRPEDWAEIDARMASGKDPLFDDATDQKFDALRQTILRWENETGQNRIKRRA
jgi:hemerythrin-like domain-containing protein